MVKTWTLDMDKQEQQQEGIRVVRFCPKSLKINEKQLFYDFLQLYI